jgi:6-phosphogluconolactonase
MIGRLHAVAAVVACAGFTVMSSTARELPQPKPSGPLVYFGTYTNNDKSKGIYVSRFNSQTGELTPPQLAGEARNPSYLAVHPKGTHVYAVSEVGETDGKPGGSVLAFRIQTDGTLAPMNRQSTVGGGPAHIVADKGGRHVLVANYGGGSVAVLPIDADGSVKPHSAFMQHSGKGADPKRQDAPHAHSINLDPANRFAYVPDLGIDKVMIYRFDSAKGLLQANDPPFAAVDPGAGPRHFAFHPQGRFAYVINEMSCKITAFTADPSKGALTPIQTISTLPGDGTVQAGYSTADVQVHPSGKFLYGSNRGHDSIAVFAIEPKTGRLTLVQHEPTGGSTPRAFGLDPSGQFLLAANQRSDSVVVFRIDQSTGRLTPTGHTISMGAPVCVKFVGR